MTFSDVLALFGDEVPKKVANNVVESLRYSGDVEKLRLTIPDELRYRKKTFLDIVVLPSSHQDAVLNSFMATFAHSISNQIIFEPIEQCDK